MGQKTHPIGFRLGVFATGAPSGTRRRTTPSGCTRTCGSRSSSSRSCNHAGVAAVEVERAANKAKINIYTARPGIVIGKRGAGVETLKKEVQALTANEVFLNIQEVRKAETNAQLVAENIATQLERRVAFRRAMKKAVQTAMKFGAKGIRVACSGRLGGAEMARYEWYHEGRVPLHTLRADIEYGIHRGAHDVRRHRRQVLDLQGRGPARSARARPALRAKATEDRCRCLLPRK